jgi:rapamycin-insensitive companion of mTOR
LLLRTLAKDNKHAIEKEQAIKLIRAVVEIGSENGGQPTAVGFGSVPLSETVMRGIVAIAEQPEDPFKTICIQTLIEIRSYFALRL